MRAHIKTNSHSRSLRSATLYACWQRNRKKTRAHTHTHHLEAIESNFVTMVPRNWLRHCLLQAGYSFLFTRGDVCVFRCRTRSGGSKERCCVGLKGGFCGETPALKCGSRRCDRARGPNAKPVLSSASDERKRSWLIAPVHLGLRIPWRR